MQGRAGTGTRTRRGVLAALLSGGATGALVACGAGSSAPAGGAGAGGTSGSAGEIVYMTPWSGVQLEIMQEVNNLFSQKFPRIKVNVAPQPSNGYDGVVASFAAGAAPDSLWVAGQYGPRLYDSDELIDVTDRFKVAKMDLQKDYISSKLELWQGKLRGVPETVSPHAWYYNKSMLKQAGGKDPWDDLKGDWTWADLLDGSKRTTKDGQDQWGIQLDYASAWYQNGGFIWTNDGKLIDTAPDPGNWRKWRYTFSDPRSVEAFQFIYDLLHTHRVMLPKEDTARVTPPGSSPWMGGKVWSFENSSGQLSGPRRTPPGFEWDVAPIPRAKVGGRVGVPLWSGNPTGIWKGSKLQDAAWEWARFKALDDAQNFFSRGKTVTAALKRSLTIADGFESPPPAHVSVFRAVKFEDSGSWHYHPRFQETEQIASRELTAAFKKEKTLRQALQDIDVACNAIMDRQV
ncbi:MAG TPA: sugar ABC transporter substrate-binding protein [Chloroflexota bacterium]|nr:sugar ABC transporter substrate-binding protein [Chloroflexota bacterium]